MLQDLQLWGNQIGDAGMSALAGVIASRHHKGVGDNDYKLWMPPLEDVKLHANPGDNAPVAQALTALMKRRAHVMALKSLPDVM